LAAFPEYLMLLMEAENYLPGHCSSGQQQDMLVRAAESTAQSLPLLCFQGLPPRAKERGCVTCLNGLRFSTELKVAALQIT